MGVLRSAVGAVGIVLIAPDDVDGLWEEPRRLPAKLLYDDRGSGLFDEITRLPEYYPSRRETSILVESAAAIIARAGATTLVELGSGTSTKTRLLLDELAPGDTYVPVDVSAQTLNSAASVLSVDYPDIDVVPIEADFTAGHALPRRTPGPQLVVFLGGTIGNFDDAERASFLSRLASALEPGDSLLLGTDLIKETSRLVAAYDDSSGVTADFNRNVLEVVRSGIGAERLYIDDFDHIARWNPVLHRIEMRLSARRDVDACFPSLRRRLRLHRDDEILTEISVKFTPEAVADELDAAGFTVADTWTDDYGDFLLTLGVKRVGGGVCNRESTGTTRG